MQTNVQRLGDVLNSRMKKTSGAAVPTILALGTINGDLSLNVDSIPDKIPQNEYMVALHLTHENYYSYNEMNSSANAPHHHEGGEHEGHTSGTGFHTHDDGLHDHRVPSVFRNLQSGDRVLVAWCGTEPVIIDIVVAGDTVTTN